MDKSKLPKLTKKSDEEPWKPTHEQGRLKDRAGTVGSNALRAIKNFPKRGGDRARSWVPDEAGDVNEKNIIHGKNKAGKPVKPRAFGLFYREKNKKEEREY